MPILMVVAGAIALLSLFVPSRPIKGPKAIFVPPGFEQPETPKPVVEYQVNK